MKLHNIIFYSAALSSIFVNAEQAPKTITVPFVKTSLKRNYSHFAKRSNATEALVQHQNIGYLVSIDVGSPSQSFNVILDTQSADIWLPGSNCSSPLCPSAKFNYNSSSTFYNLDKNFTAIHTSWNATGKYVTDSISFGGVSVSTQQFGLVTNASLSNSSNPNLNGVLGLGNPSLTYAYHIEDYSYTSLMENMINQDLIDSHVFSVYLNSTSQNGEVTLGGIDSSKYQGSISYLPVSNGSLLSDLTYYINEVVIDGVNSWMVNAKSFGISGPGVEQDDNMKDGPTFYFLVDTSSTLSYLPRFTVEKMITAIGGSSRFSQDTQTGAYIVDCNINTGSYEFYLNMVDNAFEPKTHVTLHVPFSELLIPTGETQNGTEKCIFGIAPLRTSELTGAYFVMGDSILRSFYTVFDAAQNRIGFASSVDSTSKITSNADKFHISYFVAAVGVFISLLFIYV